ncbi:MAG: 50S ribosomal protein L7Ae [Candidatus Marsarchaeota archaeon]|jgi:LSU ribosomal protein L7AE|nr:50S ribosomal protein L7Ae [Candidatus Marsarchaeota archaeon]MCL5419664.1 50S ribosomal protein L7Ae [Candidatus Marsarchaeota archaeon]
MAKAYVKFETNKDVAARISEVLGLAKQSGTVRKGANEVTKSVERGLANFVVIAEDVDPEEVVMHIPTLCEQKKIAYGYLPTKLELGKAIGINVPCAAASIEKPGGSEHMMKEVISKITGRSTGEERPAQAPKEQKQQEQKQAPKPKKEAAPAAPKAEKKNAPQA